MGDRSGRVGFWGAAAIGVGGMVGGGIFAVLGVSVQMARGGAPIAFLVAGGVALLTAYSYARLSVTYPSQGGTVEFLNRAFGRGLLSGGLNVLLWFSYVVMLALYAYAFGSYAASFLPAGLQSVWKHVFLSGAIVVFTVLNAIGAGVASRAETTIVAIKLAILLLFVGVGLWQVDLGWIAPTAWSSPLGVIGGGMVIFLATRDLS